MKKLFVIVLALGLLTGLQTGAAYAQAEHEAETEAAHEEEHAESPLMVAFRWANFAILVGLLGYLLKKPAQEFFSTRTQQITTGLQRAKQAQADAEARMREIEERMNRLSEDLAALKAQADAEASRERENILAEARREATRVIEQSRQELERLAKGIERDIRESVADVVVARASETLATGMTEDDQKRVVVRFLKDL